MDEEKCAIRCIKRMRPVLEYTEAETFGIDVCAGSLSSTPRWRFARALEVRETDGTSPRLGNALLPFYESTRNITRGGNALTEHIFERGVKCRIDQAIFVRAIIREYLYLAGK